MNFQRWFDQADEYDKNFAIAYFFYIASKMELWDRLKLCYGILRGREVILDIITKKGEIK